MPAADLARRDRVGMEQDDVVGARPVGLVQAPKLTMSCCGSAMCSSVSSIRTRRGNAAGRASRARGARPAGRRPSVARSDRVAEQAQPARTRGTPGASGRRRRLGGARHAAATWTESPVTSVPSVSTDPSAGRCEP
jgi:hypothetical protein